VCLGGRCSFFNYCRAGGDICETNSDCCDGGCDPTTHRCDLLTQCVPTDEPCNGLRSCCDTLCVPNGFGSSYCYAMCGCRADTDVCASDTQCCSGSCGAPDADGVRRCNKVGPNTGGKTCLADGDVCGGLGTSQNCCNGGKASCLNTSDGVSRCFPNPGACYPAGHACALCDSCCSHVCVPSGPGGQFQCAAACIPVGNGTCTSDSDCCAGGVCQEGKCVPSGSKCVATGGACTQTADCCNAACVGGFCVVP
jgi:hypothetical protein